MNDRILVLDGEEKLRNRYQHELQALGYQVITAGDSRIALEKIKCGSVDLVIMDLELPDGSGFDCLERLMSLRRQVKVVINTTDASYKEDFHSWIADAFLMKSADLNELTHTVNDILQPN
ncbi:MAG: response regulator [bacterium]